ncbi:hypothetical protein [Photorhabdus heterorhabditis]|uniref:hypothetical protein n=1 Tax=Photorhabdus heterorhabditis TaxID=880156 RepID=UPI0015629CEF|nr:hypothetical protein [Photorhabdus heterorhabditis]NRN29148.1 hypothetical protein [Photorhabdus heterorhabditis subsp. aluminescens]
MDGAKEIAEKMVSTINDDSSWLTGFSEGVLDIPVDFYYLGYDYLDTDHRWDNENDKYRFVGLIKSEAITLNNLERVIQIIFEDYLGKLSEEQKQRLIETKVGKIFGGSMTLVGTLGIGASVSRAIYTSRELAQTNPNLYMLLRREGNLDLLYFLVESKMESYVRALEAYEEDRSLFNEFSAGLDK